MVSIINQDLVMPLKHLWLLVLDHTTTSDLLSANVFL